MRRHSKFPTIDTFNISVAPSWEFSFSMFRYILPCNKRDCFKWWPIKLHSPLNFIQHSMCFCYCKKHLRYRISYHISHVDCKKSSSTIKKTKEPLNILLFFHQIKKINAQRKRLSCSCIINNLSWRIHLISNINFLFITLSVDSLYAYTLFIFSMNENRHINGRLVCLSMEIIYSMPPTPIAGIWPLGRCIVLINVPCALLQWLF